MPDFSELFAFESGVVEMVIRGSVVYWFLFGLLRIAGRRDMGSIGVTDLLVLVLVADAAGNAMASESTSLSDGMVVVATIVGWSVLLDRIAYWSPAAKRWLEAGKVCVVRDGQMDRRGMRREHITPDELFEALRLQGIASLNEVRRAYVESNGEISVVRNKNPAPGGRSTLADDRADA